MNHRPIHVSPGHFEKVVLRSELPVLVDFWAPWCGPCQAVAPILDELAGEMAGRLVIAKVNTDDNQEKALEHGVQGIPTLILFRGGHEVDRVVGLLTKREMKRWLDGRLAAVAVA